MADKDEYAPNQGGQVPASLEAVADYIHSIVISGDYELLVRLAELLDSTSSETEFAGEREDLLDNLAALITFAQMEGAEPTDLITGRHLDDLMMAFGFEENVNESLDEVLNSGDDEPYPSVYRTNLFPNIRIVAGISFDGELTWVRLEHKPQSSLPEAT